MPCAGWAMVCGMLGWALGALHGGFGGGGFHDRVVRVRDRGLLLVVKEERMAI